MSPPWRLVDDWVGDERVVNPGRLQDEAITKDEAITIRLRADLFPLGKLASGHRDDDISVLGRIYA